jgi:Flp pilus assembly protein TadG
MPSDTPRLDGLNSEKIAEMASRFIRQGEEYTRTDQETAAYAQATAYAATGLLGEAYKIRLALERLVREG